jgi:hypothetical protein
MGAPRARQSAGPKWPTARDTAAQYNFIRAPGREHVVEAFDNLLGVLRARDDEHIAHGNRDLAAMTRDLAQRVMVDLEKFCRKWEESDRRGQTY